MSGLSFCAQVAARARSTRSGDLEVAHHGHVLVFEVVAVEHVSALVAGEPDEDFRDFVGAYVHGVASKAVERRSGTSEREHGRSQVCHGDQQGGGDSGVAGGEGEAGLLDDGGGQRRAVRVATSLTKVASSTDRAPAPPVTTSGRPLRTCQATASARSTASTRCGISAAVLTASMKTVIAVLWCSTASPSTVWSIRPACWSASRSATSTNRPSTAVSATAAAVAVTASRTSGRRGGRAWVRITDGSLRGVYRRSAVNQPHE